MPSFILGGAQMGPIQRADSREVVVGRMMELMREAHSKGVHLVVFPELALTTFFPRWYVEDRSEMDCWFETEMPNSWTMPLFELSKELGVAMTFGYAELTSEVELRIDPLDPECIILTYLPVTAGRLIFRRTGAERETDFRNEVSVEDIGREQVLLWRAEGLSDGEVIGVRYRSGWRLATHELPVSRAGPGG